jgi:hypothetical protein
VEAAAAAVEVEVEVEVEAAVEAVPGVFRARARRS